MEAIQRTEKQHHRRWMREWQPCRHSIAREYTYRGRVETAVALRDTHAAQLGRCAAVSPVYPLRQKAGIWAWRACPDCAAVKREHGT